MSSLKPWQSIFGLHNWTAEWRDSSWGLISPESLILTDRPSKWFIDTNPSPYTLPIVFTQIINYPNIENNEAYCLLVYWFKQKAFKQTVMQIPLADVVIRYYRDNKCEETWILEDAYIASLAFTSETTEFPGRVQIRYKEIYNTIKAASCPS